MPRTAGYITYGSSSDLWGTSITQAQVNASDFGVSVVYTFDDLCLNGISVYVDHIRITVYYTASGGGGSSTKTLGLLGVG